MLVMIHDDYFIEYGKDVDDATTQEPTTAIISTSYKPPATRAPPQTRPSMLLRLRRPHVAAVSPVLLLCWHASHVFGRATAY